MEMPTSKTFTLMMMMNTLSDKLPHVRDQIADAIVHSSVSDPYTPLMAYTRLEMEQQIMDSRPHPLGLSPSWPPLHPNRHLVVQHLLVSYVGSRDISNVAST